MRSSRTAEARERRDENVGPALGPAPAEAPTLRPREMPFEPSVPCAACARGTDPLRAACVALTDEAVRYFCSRTCRDESLQREAERARVRPQTSAPRPKRAGSEPSGAYAQEPVTRRPEPPRIELPHWPLIAIGLALPLLYVEIPHVRPLALLVIVTTAAVLTTHARDARRLGGVLAALSAPLGIGLLALSALLDDARSPAIAAALGVLVMWLRERLVRGAEAEERAGEAALAARLPRRARVSLPPASSGGDHTPSYGSGPEPSLTRSAERALGTVSSGDELLLEAPEVVPVDGIIAEGRATLLPYPDAREPVLRSAGDAVVAGARLLEGSLTVRAVEVGPRRTLFRLFASDDGSDADRTSLGARLARIARHPLALAAYAAIALLAAWLTADGFAALTARLGAAAIALPVLAIVRGARAPWRAAMLRAARRGIRFRDARVLDEAGRVDTVVLRVEGALIERDYTLVEVTSLSEAFDATLLLRAAVAVEAAAEGHPLARAVLAYAEPLGIEPLSLRRVSPLPGSGIGALTEEHGALVLGSREALRGAGISAAVADREAQAAESAGHKVVFLALGGHVRGLFSFAEIVRPEAKVALDGLHALGLEIALVASEHRTTVETLTRGLPVSWIKAELTSAQRSAEIARLCDGDARVLALGTTPADDALFTAADVGLALGAAGGARDVPIATAAADLRDATAALAIARLARRTLRQVLIASAVGVALSLGAALGLAAPLVVAVIAALVDLACLSGHTLHARRGAAARLAAAPTSS